MTIVQEEGNTTTGNRAVPTVNGHHLFCCCCCCSCDSCWSFSIFVFFFLSRSDYDVVYEFAARIERRRNNTRCLGSVILAPT